MANGKENVLIVIGIILLALVSVILWRVEVCSCKCKSKEKYSKKDCCTECDNLVELCTNCNSYICDQPCREICNKVNLNPDIYRQKCCDECK